MEHEHGNTSHARPGERAEEIDRLAAAIKGKVIGALGPAEQYGQGELLSITLSDWPEEWRAEAIADLKSAIVEMARLVGMLESIEDDPPFSGDEPPLT